MEDSKLASLIMIMILVHT